MLWHQVHKGRRGKSTRNASRSMRSSIVYSTRGGKSHTSEHRLLWALVLRRTPRHYSREMYRCTHHLQTYSCVCYVQLRATKDTNVLLTVSLHVSELFSLQTCHALYVAYVTRYCCVYILHMTSRSSAIHLSPQRTRIRALLCCVSFP